MEAGPSARMHFYSQRRESIDPSYVPKVLRKASTFDVNLVDAEKESKVLVLFTGGTIGMRRNKAGALVPIPNALVDKIRQNPDMHDAEAAKAKFGNVASSPLVLPLKKVNLSPLQLLNSPLDNTAPPKRKKRKLYQDTREKRRIIYTVFEYEPLLDSSNMTMDDWINIAKDIRQSYEHFDGFVVLHGTDTLAYTASALSFMLENLGKTVIITGSQIPLFETRSDGRDNFLNALIIAGNYCIPEVTVFFGHQLFRGNRTTKVSTGSLNAFNSPNLTPLATAGIDIDVDFHSIFRPSHIEKFDVHMKLSRNVGLLRLFPSITTQMVQAFLQHPIEGVVLQTYGAGNIPSKRQDLMDVLREATDRGVLIINITQCQQGSVQGLYETGKALSDAGVISGSDMTPEAALSKLSYVLSKEDLDLQTKKRMVQSNLRGEMTVIRPSGIQDFDLVEAVARSLHLSSSAEMEQLRRGLFPAMLCAAAGAGDLRKLEALKGYGADLSSTDQDFRTALHVACCTGDEKVVEFLLLNGACIHLKDRFGHTPLLDAIEFDHHDVIRLLRRCGAHLTMNLSRLGEQLCSAATTDNLIHLQSLKLAGADLSQPDHSGRTALHVAVLHNSRDCFNYLVDTVKVNLQSVDLLGNTPLDIAKKMQRDDLIEPLQQAISNGTT